jgi:stage V sporulation protein AF
MSNQTKVFAEIEDNENFLTDRLGIGVSYDVSFREVVVLGRKTQLYFVNGLTNDDIIQEVLKEMLLLNERERETEKLPEILDNRLIHLQVEHLETLDESVDEMLTGLVVLFVDGYNKSFVIDVRNYPGRTPEEPDTEKVIRGSRDGYTENIVENTALTRRRLRDARLRNVMTKVGERSKTDVCVMYIEDIANDGLVELVKQRIEEIEIDGLSMADKSLEEFIIETKWNVFPLVRYTERPDVASNHLIEGHVLITVDASPSVIILPTTYFHHLQHAEEYRQSPVFGTFVRWNRFFAVFISIFLLPLWLLMVQEPQLLPSELAFIGPNDEGNIPIFIQILIADIGIEFLRMAAVHTPTPLSTAMSLIAAILIGQIAIDVGLFTPEVILYVSIAAIGSYVTPSYELGTANKLLKYFLVIATGLFGVSGFMVGVTFIFLFLVSKRSLKTPYFWPFIPYNPSALLHILFRIPVPYEAHTRPSIVHPKNNYRKPTK